MASGDAVERIKEKLSIVDVVATYVELHPAGKNMKGKSPFTNERTPSFYVSPDRGMYYCFSSSQGGDMFTFVQKMEGVDSIDLQYSLSTSTDSKSVLLLVNVRDKNKMAEIDHYLRGRSKRSDFLLVRGMGV